MFNRGEREKERMAAETAPYRQMAVDLEVETKLQSQGFDLAVADRHLLTSNDRQQLSAAYLHTARDRYLIAGSVASAVGSEASKDSTQTIEATTSFVTSMYQGAKNSLETAEQISAQQGFQAGPAEIQRLNKAQNAVEWPRPDSISVNFVGGLIAGLDQTWVHAYHHYEATMSSRSVPNDFKRRLQNLTDPLLRTIDNKRKAIERVALGGIVASTPEPVVREMYSDCQAVYTALAEFTTLLTMPRARDAAFTLREQYNEAAPEKKSFNPSSLGSPAVQRTVTPPQRASKPFSADILGTSTPPAKRPFNPDVLGTPSSQRKPGEFDPSFLDPNRKK
jgi:hypothetical protein